ncbi:hypothetical protein ARMSODRAFT_1018902 [Armillaria solidipes]|uniref:Uncharacterized protein n=1 Tax=Armillaria solidipes TaxID=1076256 RepID=A0A2H3C2I2_9AGAR|nr:hypothetical protein ARMSODRAFT_1018902 [Armillaria solidipes]
MTSPFHQRSPNHKESSRFPEQRDVVTRRRIFTRGVASWVLEGKDTVDDLRAEVPIFPPSTAPYDNLFLDFAQRRRMEQATGEAALDNDGKREHLEGCVCRNGSVPDQRNVGCSTLH